MASDNNYCPEHTECIRKIENNNARVTGLLVQVSENDRQAHGRIDGIERAVKSHIDESQKHRDKIGRIEMVVEEVVKYLKEQKTEKHQRGLHREWKIALIIGIVFSIINVVSMFVLKFL